MTLYHFTCAAVLPKTCEHTSMCKTDWTYKGLKTASVLISFYVLGIILIHILCAWNWVRSGLIWVRSIMISKVFFTVKCWGWIESHSLRREAALYSGATETKLTVCRRSCHQNQNQQNPLSVSHMCLCRESKGVPVLGVRAPGHAEVSFFIASYVPRRAAVPSLIRRCWTGLAAMLPNEAGQGRKC